MKKNILLLLMLCVVFSCAPQESKESKTGTETSVYYLIRHAEKDRSDETNNNPSLTNEGRERANKWAKIFDNINFDAVYSTEYNRTRETATPTAAAKELEIISYHPTKIDMDDFIKKTKGKTTLIVGHSNTTPAFANKLLNEEKFEDIDDSNNGNLYIVTITGNSKTVQLLTVN